MTKKHHPHNRAERLALKLEHEEKKAASGKVRKHLRETLKERETQDELREFVH